MQILTTIFRDPGLDIHGKTDHRTAVRAVAIREKELGSRSGQVIR
jgi:hypothetical protein